MDWFGPPHSFTVWPEPSLEWALVVQSGWRLRWEGAQSEGVGVGVGGGKTLHRSVLYFK